MVKKCVYCNKHIDENSVIDVCDICGIKVWGERMFNAIKSNMNEANNKGNLFQGSITENINTKIK
ncbi:MAG: hypothetical protein QW117_01355 [Candidatus Pacearchaeota archaeon]